MIGILAPTFCGRTPLYDYYEEGKGEVNKNDALQIRATRPNHEIKQNKYYENEPELP